MNDPWNTQAGPAALAAIAANPSPVIQNEPTRQQRRAAERAKAGALASTARKGERVKRIMRRGLVSASEAADIAEGVAREAWAGGSPMADLVKAQTAPRAA